jgi:Transposase domain (DUF772)
MLLALLIYAYSDGIRSSRQIERLCRTDVAMRVITGQQVPDHTVIARFRQRHQDSVRELFTRVLLVCPKAGLGRLGTIAVDGTKIAANASRQATCRRQWLQEQVDQIVAQAAAIDAAEDAASGGETPWQRRGRRDRRAAALGHLRAPHGVVLGEQPARLPLPPRSHQRGQARSGPAEERLRPRRLDPAAPARSVHLADEREFPRRAATAPHSAWDRRPAPSR